MIPNIIHREVITLPEKQLQMLRSGWGAPAINDTITESIIYMSDGYEVHGYLAYPKALYETAKDAESAKDPDEDADTHGLDGSTQIENKSHLTSNISHLKNSLRPSRSLRLEDTKLPCIIWNRGGSKERGAIDRFTAVGMFGQLASWGFVVFASMYRATFIREMEDDFGGDEVNDILNLMDIAKHIPFADTTRWAMEGWSRGGMMTWLALRKRHDVKVAITLGGITDIAECCDSVPRIKATLQHVIAKEGSSVLQNRSSVNFADELPRECKYLIIHGTKDDVVSPRQALQLADKLLEQGLHFRLVLMEESDHYLKGKRKEVDALRREWFSKYI